jgi:hypothetical protein
MILWKIIIQELLFAFDTGFNFFAGGVLLFAFDTDFDFIAG